MAASVVIKRVVTIECDEGMLDWTVKHLEVIEGREYVKLSARCSGFQRFVGGKLYRSEMKVAQMPYLNELAHRRTQATVDATLSTADEAPQLFDSSSELVSLGECSAGTFGGPTKGT